MVGVRFKRPVMDFREGELGDFSLVFVVVDFNIRTPLLALPELYRKLFFLKGTIITPQTHTRKFKILYFSDNFGNTKKIQNI